MGFAFKLKLTLINGLDFVYKSRFGGLVDQGRLINHLGMRFQASSLIHCITYTGVGQPQQSPGVTNGGYFSIKTGNSSQPLSLSQATQYVQSHFTQI